MAYKCIDCGSDKLFGLVVVSKFFPLAARQGSIKLAGKGIDQVEIKLAWDKDVSGEEKQTKGTIVCSDCESRFIYILEEDALHHADGRG